MEQADSNSGIIPPDDGHTGQSQSHPDSGMLTEQSFQNPNFLTSQLDTEEFGEFTKVLFPNGDNHHKQLFGADELAYLSRLGTQGLESLMGEVARVNEELAIIEHQTRDMASQNYQIFVQSAQTTNLIKKSLSEAKNSVETLSSKTFPDFRKKTDTFLSPEGPSFQFQQNLQGIQTLFEKEEEISQVLDMPWVVRRCLANGDDKDKMLPEAIKILHIVMDYKKSVGEDEDKIPSVLGETMSSVLDLQTQIQNVLLQKLQSPSIGLSECLQTVQLLRNFFPSDKALRFRFLQSRMNYQIEFENSRSWIFDTLTQHRAAFGQDSNHYLSTFIALQLTRVLNDLQKHIEHQNLDSLYTNANYFGESLARVGADLRGLAGPLFSDFIIRKASHDLLQAEMNFSKQLHQFNLSTCLIQQQNLEEDNENLEVNANPTDLTPPMKLLAFYPLASYCNEVLTFLNFVGKCPLAQSVEISKKLNQSLAKVGNELEGWGESEWLTWEIREQNLFNRMRRFYEMLLVPHVDKAFKSIYPVGNIASVTGLNVAKCAEITQIRYFRQCKS